MTAIGIWFLNSEIEVPHSFLPNSESEYLEFGPTDDFRYGISIDTNGELWFRTQKLSISEAVTRLRLLHEEQLLTIRSASEPPWGLVFTPPERSLRNRRQFMGKLDKLKKALAKAGITLSAPPYIKDPESGS